jgi:DNA-binding response OmpR family regulator/nitrogen-specific signal transduction histidine kinase
VAYIIYFLIGAAIIFTIFRYYYIALTARNNRKIDLFEREKEREIYNAKIEFFTNIAHEIRTPLTLIKMPLDKLIGQLTHNADIKENLNIMRKNTNRLIDLTNQLLDFRKAEANKFSLTFTKTDINELLTEMQAIFKAAADQKNISFKIEVPRITLHAFVDEEAVKKILANLINNAIKYSEKKVLIRLLPFSSEDTMFHIEFKNDGYLIPPELKDKIFEPFYRIKETEKEAGTGIGLPLAKALAELHKGSLELKNAMDDTNLFLLSLPIHQDQEINLIKEEATQQEADTVSPEKSVPSNPAKPLILLVEDNKEILGFIRKELSPDYNMLTAINGQDALASLQKENVHLVISDIMMPVMDGIELCKRMKTDLQYSHIPIILLTAKNSLNSKIEGLEVGADAYIEKPFAFEHLQAQITNLITNRNIIKEYFAHSPLTHLKGIAHSKADKSFIEVLNTIIYDNITNMDLDVDQLSKMMNMSRPTLYRKIKALSDLTPNELINLSRLKKAAELLAEGKYKINEVANTVGYTVHANFSRDFHKQFGVTPSNYIKNLQNEHKAD